MAGRLAAVPEETANGSAAAYPALYRDSIRHVAVSGAEIRFTLFPLSHSQSHSGHSGSSYSSGYLSSNSGYSSGSAVSEETANPPQHDLYRAWIRRMIFLFIDSGPSNSCLRNNSSGHSLGLVSANGIELVISELTRIARQMVTDGFTQRMVQALNNKSTSTSYSGDPLVYWWCELGVDWVPQIRNKHYSLKDKPASSLQDFVQSWIQALIIIAVSITELVVTVDVDVLEVARFGKASMAEMLIFVDAIIPVLKAERKLQAMLHMYTCVSRAWHMFSSVAISLEAQSILNEIGSLLEKELKRLSEAVFSLMEEVKTLVEDDDSWATEIPRGRGEVHRSTRFMVDCILSARVHDTGDFTHMIQATLNYLKDLLLSKSELCSDPGLRYLFLLNNYYFAAQMIEPCEPAHDWKLTQLCETYMFRYLDVSWGHVLSCTPKSNLPGPLHRWINTSSLAKFQSTFHKTYQAHKFWKVPDPRLRDELRRAITARVISGYRDYLEKHPELEKHIGRESSPEVLEEMLAELFEG